MAHIQLSAYWGHLKRLTWTPDPSVSTSKVLWFHFYHHTWLVSLPESTQNTSNHPLDDHF